MAVKVATNTDSRHSLSTVQAKIRPASETIGPARLCIYARNKVGKTWFAGSSNKRTLLIDCHDRGTETIADRPNVDVFTVEKYPEIDEAFWFLSTQPHDYEVYAIDNVTMLATLAMQHVLGERSRDQVAEPLIPKFDQWNKVTQMLNNVFLEWNALPMTAVWLAQERVFTVADPDREGEMGEQIAPSLSAAALSTLMGAVGTIGRLYVATVEKEVNGKTVKVKERRLLLEPRAPYLAGTRIKGLPRVMRIPNEQQRTLQKILDIRDQRGEAPVTASTEEAGN